jgi:hypothetical protein
VEEICKLQEDPGSGRDFERRAPARLLVRYVLMFFDHDYGARSLFDDYLRDFANRHREYRPPASVIVSMEETGRIFGKEPRALKN